MTSSGSDGEGEYLGSHLASAQIASQIGAQMRSQIFGMDPDTMSAIHKLTGVSSQVAAFRSSISEQLFPTMQSISAFNSELISPTLSETYARLAGINTAQDLVAQSPAFKSMAATLTELAGNFNSVVSPALTESMRSIVDTGQLTRTFFDSPALSETIARIGQINAEVGNFARIYAQTTQPLMDSLQAVYEGSKLFDSLDLSVFGEVDEEAFEDFLEEHPELEETYETIERSLVGKGLISKETLRSAASRFRSSRVGRHLLIAALMFSVATAFYVGANTVPDEVKEEVQSYMSYLGFVYTAYAVHAGVKKLSKPSPDED